MPLILRTLSQQDSSQKRNSPLLVVEVFSESIQTTDYRSKPSKYAVLEITEYCIIFGSITGIVTVCTPAEQFSDAVAFPG
ncbi:MAG TPA: Uma2 family endonuclease [Trichormus sp. M33_DOE_039]|nr:Uma2 family endonuclease [Trichormus sp. M33_DOE_039]